MSTQTLTIIDVEYDCKGSYVYRWDFNWDSVFNKADVAGQGEQGEQGEQLEQENEFYFLLTLTLF